MEVCVDSVKTALNAAVGGAIRIQLCSGISEGGETPSLGLFRVIRKMIKIPIFVTIRANTETDYVFTDDEVEVMIKDIFLFKENGADGFVFGALKSNRSVDVLACKALLSAAGSLPVTFSRALDFTYKPYKALDEIIKLGFKNVLTSGCANTAEEGCKMIRRFVLLAKNNINIIPGIGIDKFNLEHILNDTKVLEVHVIPTERNFIFQMLEMANVLQRFRINKANILQAIRFYG